MKIKKFTVLLVIGLVFIGLVVSGCSKKNDDEGSIISGLELSLEELPQEIVEQVSENKKEESYAAYNLEDKTYLVAAWGEKNSGGYNVEITKILEKENALEVSLQFTAPDKDDLVTTALTYPFAVKSIPQTTKENIIFMDSEGKELATVKVETLAVKEDVTVNLYYPAENGGTEQETRVVDSDFRSLSPEMQAEIILQEYKKGSQNLEIENLDKIVPQHIDYSQDHKTLTVTLADNFLEIPEKDRDMIADAIILSFTSIFEPVKFNLDVVSDSGENLEEYTKSFK